MTLRRALSASPLALLVAVVAHVSAFGFSHAPGAERAPELLGALGAALALGVAGAFTSGLLGGLRTDAEPVPARWYAPLFLAAAGAASFGCIEFSEGHFALRTLLEAAVVSVPLAYLVAFVARATRRVLRTAGATYGDYICQALPRAGRATARIAYRFGASVCRSFVAGAVLRGRAPPALV
jgi:hypothetical protein